jgi:hypothetical protein
MFPGRCEDAGFGGPEAGPPRTAADLGPVTAAANLRSAPRGRESR